MANIETIELDALNFAEVAAPSTPSAASVIVYAKSDGLLYSKDDAGVEKLISSGPAGSAEFATGNAKVATSETTTSTSYTDLTTPGPAVTVTVGASGKVMLHVKARISNSAAGNYGAVGVALSGANTVAAATVILNDSQATNSLHEWGASTMLTGLTPGSTTFTCKYIVEAGTGTFGIRELTVAPVL